VSLINELKRRNVFRVGIAYAVGGWLLLQLTDVLSELLKLPDEIGPIVVTIVAIGFPIAMFFAWAFELTPEGIKRESEVDRSESITPKTGKKLNNAILVLMALAIAYLLFDKFSGSRPESASVPVTEIADAATQPDAAPIQDATPEIQRQSIAVLPFDNRSRDADDAFFVEGIHDDLLTNLARIGSLKVISRTSVTKYKDTEKTIPEIAAELGVATIMEGAVQRAGNQVRINVQLIDAQTDEHLWAEIFDRELSAENLFVIQSEISEAIADSLKAQLTNAEQQRINSVPTQNLAAYEAYLHGRQQLATRASEQLQQAVTSFKHATELDPQFALAWVGLADSYNLLRAYGAMPSNEARPLAQAAIEQALRLDPQLGEAHTTLASLQSQAGDWEQAEVSYRKAIELSPNYAQAYQWFSDSLINTQPLRIDEAISLAQKSIELDPNSPIMSVNLGDTYENKGLYQMAQRQYEKSIELNPEFFPGYVGLAAMLTYNVSRYPEALRYHESAIERDPGNIGPYFGIMNIYLEIGDRQKAQAARERLAEVNPEREWAGVADMIFNTVTGNAGGVREAVNWLLPRAEGNRGRLQFMATNLANVNETQKALELYLAAQPGWTDPAQWDRMVDEEGAARACQVAWLLLRAGDATNGAGLLTRASHYVEEELPAVMEHAEAQGAIFCQLARGDNEQALTTLETMLAHNHLFGWDAPIRSTLFDPIRDEPRFIAAVEERERRLTQQRAEIESMQPETGP
jgi:TolB-like protein/cytochrome c-type biogenesis protein CcmH/NrfG